MDNIKIIFVWLIAICSSLSLSFVEANDCRTVEKAKELASESHFSWNTFKRAVWQECYEEAGSYAEFAKNLNINLKYDHFHGPFSIEMPLLNWAVLLEKESQVEFLLKLGASQRVKFPEMILVGNVGSKLDDSIYPIDYARLKKNRKIVELFVKYKPWWHIWY